LKSLGEALTSIPFYTFGGTSIFLLCFTLTGILLGLPNSADFSLSPLSLTTESFDYFFF
jgi:hypothetical protein